MPCTCAKGKFFSDLLLIANGVASLLSCRINRRLSGVALSGSIARRESHCHDIDLVVFHGGSLADGNCRNIKRDSGTDVLLESMVGDWGAHVLRDLTDVSVSYFFVHEKILWDCEYFQSFARKERFPGFYRTIISQTPLFLLWYSEGAKSLLQFVDGIKATKLYESGDGKVKYMGTPIRHRCGEKGCTPVAPWDEVHKQILARKEHGRSILRD